jgi:hypothetical protein
MPAMRGTWIVVALVACHHADGPAPVAPQGPTQCARAADNMVQTMLDRLPDRLPAKNNPPTDEADALRNLIRGRCEHDGWSAEATRCLIAMQRLGDAEGCAKLMTDEQQAALVRDEQAQFGAAPGDAAPAASLTEPEGAEAPAAAPAGQAAPAAPPGPAAPSARPPPAAPRKQPAKAKKTKGNSAAGDPFRGGE